MNFFFKWIFKEESYRVIGSSVIITLLSLSIFFFIVYLKNIIKGIKKQNKTSVKWLVVGFFIIQSFFIHPLFFFLDLSTDWRKASDGQALFGIVQTFPFSSLFLILFGVILDFFVTKLLKQNQTK